jgi:O-acetylhomoserine (thiol)-lyase
MSGSTKPETIVLHAGYRADPATGSVAVPLYQTTSYQFRDTQHAADLFALKELGNIYTRLMNPTNDVLEQRIAALEGGAAAVAVGSGQAASTFSVLNIAQAGDNIVSSTDLYGGTWNLFANTFKQMGIEVRFADPSDPENFRRLTDDKTRAYYAETLPNPKLQVFPIREVANIGDELGIPLIMDNTAAPVLCRPIDHGATIVMYSTTKFIAGHGTSVGGIVVDSGKFDWKASADKFPMMNQPDPSYHGVVYTEALGEAAFIGRCRVVPLRNTGSALSPFNSFLIMQGLETLALRMERHCDNAQKVAQFLQDHPAVEWVNYAGLANSPYKATCDKICGGKASGILSFGIKGGREAGAKFIDALDLILRLVNIGDAKSLACHPATTTHRQLNADELKSAGVSEDLVRLSIGIEDADDIIADITQALEKSQA